MNGVVECNVTQQRQFGVRQFQLVVMIPANPTSPPWASLFKSDRTVKMMQEDESFFARRPSPQDK